MDDLARAMEELDEATALALVDGLVAANAKTIDILRMLNEGMLLVGNRFADGQYFIADLIMSGVIYRRALDKLELGSIGGEKEAKVLIGVVKNDIHDIGKDIVVSTLKSDGFNVIDIGMDVEAEQFVKEALVHRPDIIALSGTMSYAAREMGRIISLLGEAGVRDFAKVIVGGLCMDENKSIKIGADAYSKDPIGFLKHCRELTDDK